MDFAASSALPFSEDPSENILLKYQIQEELNVLQS